MKNLLFIIPALILLALSSCDKDDEENKETFITVGLIKKIDIADIESIYTMTTMEEIFLVARYHVAPGAGARSADEDPGDTRFMLRVPFDGESASFDLPQDPPQELLRNITNDFPEGFTISDEDASTISFVEIGCGPAGSERVHEFLYLRKNPEGIEYSVHYIYSDRPAKIEGTASDWWGHSATYDLTLQKGWNMVIEKREYRDSAQYLTVNNLMPSGMYWYCSMWIGGR